MGLFNQLPTFLPDSILGLQKTFLKDGRSDKVNLLLGTYMHPSKKYGGLSSLRKAQTVVLEDETNKSYLPISGFSPFTDEMIRLILGEERLTHAIGCQSLGGTGALHLGALLFSMVSPSGTVYLPEQSWGNHARIFAHQGLQLQYYPYYDVQNKKLDYERILETLHRAPRHSLILFQCCCHNPTGMDPDAETWKSIVAILQERELIPFFDAAYVGFAQGIEQDVFPIRLSTSLETVFVAACSSKNFSLYGSRVGCLIAHSHCSEELTKISSCLEEKIRGEYSSPPREGAQIVATILSNPYLKQEWVSELNVIREALNKKRCRFVAAMQNVIGSAFDMINRQCGFFGYPGFSQKQVNFLREAKGIYTTSGGRFNLNGISDRNIDYIVRSFTEAYGL